MENFKLLKDAITEYLAHVNDISENPVKNANFPYVFSCESHRILQSIIKNESIGDLKLVLVGDNPGNKEKADHIFLHPAGKAGKPARTFFKLAYGEDCFSSRILILNKSCYHTTSTGDLAPIKNESWFKYDLERNAELIGAFRKCGIQVIILGISEMEGIFTPFTKQLKDRGYYSATKNVPHFSYSSIFQKNSDPSWSDRINLFLSNRPELATDNGNVSWALIQQLPTEKKQALCKEYLETVILK